MAMSDSHFQPEEFDIPSRFRHFGDDAAEDLIGPFFACNSFNGAETAFRVQEKNCNIMGACHGGMLMAFADFTMGMCQFLETGKAALTITCNNEFTRGAQLGDLVIGRGKISRETGSMFFLSCELYVENELILSSSAVFKKLKQSFDQIGSERLPT